MLNIGRLGTNIATIVDYYTADVADAADLSIPSAARPTNHGHTHTESYYMDHKDAPGRWVGALCNELGVNGDVDGDSFRRLLSGCHPVTGEPLTPGAVTAQAQRNRPYQRSSTRLVDSPLSVSQVAQRLEMNPRWVRRMLERGSVLDDEAPDRPCSYLKGSKTQKNKFGPGRAIWQVPIAEVERFTQSRETSAIRPGFDLALRPPKSVSILWALGKPEWSEVVAQAHRESVDQVIDYYESSAIFSRKRIDGKQMRIATEGLIGAAFDHRTSRAGDPLLHTHVVLFNATLCADSQWRSLDGTPLYEHAKTAGYLYQAHLRHVFRENFVLIGLKW